MTSIPVPDPNVQPIDWNAIDTVIMTWLERVLPDVNHMSGQQDAAVEYPYVSFNRIAGPTREGGIDEVRTMFDATADPGEEIVTAYMGPREFTVSLTAHVTESSGSLDPNCDGVALISKLEASLDMDSIQEIFRAACMAVIEPQAVSDVSVTINGEWVSRGNLDIRFRTTSVMTERETFIEQVQLVSTELGIDTTVDAS